MEARRAATLTSSLEVLAVRTLGVAMLGVLFVQAGSATALAQTDVELHVRLRVESSARHRSYPTPGHGSRRS